MSSPFSSTEQALLSEYKLLLQENRRLLPDIDQESTLQQLENALAFEQKVPLLMVSVKRMDSKNTL
jgi:Ubiquitin-like domain